VEQAINVLEQYELEVKGVRKGRGNWIVSSKEGEFVLKEYNGNEERAILQKLITDRIMQKTGVLVQEIVPNKEGKLCTGECDAKKFTLQTYMEGRECDLKDQKDCIRTVTAMAQMHKGMYFSNEESMSGICAYSLKNEFRKRNNELRRVRRYLKEKKQKNEFERFIYKHFERFFETALEVEESWEQYEPYVLSQADSLFFCHGDFQHHNVWMNHREMMILQFEKFVPDLPCRDLYLFMRKLSEKNNWDCTIGKEILKTYEKERELSIIERISMVYRFAYPEKFWKIVNYYFNSKKSFMPEKNMEKFVKVLEQEEYKEHFINETLRKLM